MSILGWIIFGALIGWIASMIVGKDAQMGAVANIVVGIIGSFIGGFISTQLGMGSTTGEFSLIGVVMSVVGAIVLLFIVNLVRR